MVGITTFFLAGARVAQKEEASQRASLEEVYNSLLASRTEVSLSEVEQLISIAKRQLYLLGNVKGASIALSQAIELLEGTDKPSLLNLRTALEKDLSEIKALPSDDLLRLAISLDSVVNSVESLPLLSSVQATTDQTLAEMTEEPVVVEQATAETEHVLMTMRWNKSMCVPMAWATAALIGSACDTHTTIPPGCFARMSSSALTMRCCISVKLSPCGKRKVLGAFCTVVHSGFFISAVSCAPVQSPKSHSSKPL